MVFRLDWIDGVRYSTPISATRKLWSLPAFQSNAGATSAPFRRNLASEAGTNRAVTSTFAVRFLCADGWRADPEVHYASMAGWITARQRHLVLCATLLLACTSKRPRTAPPSETGPSPSAALARSTPFDVRGLVVDRRGGLPVAGQTIAIGERRAVTDAKGRFAVVQVPPTYDVVLVNPERSLVTLYSALQRRDPVLVHRVERKLGAMAHTAEISGTLVGGGEYPLTEALHVNFQSHLATADILLGGLNAPNALGPGFGPLRLQWEGGASIVGNLISRRGGTKASPTAYCAHAKVSLQAGSRKRVDLEFKQVPLVRRKPVSVGFPESGNDAPRVYEDYRFPGTGFVLHGSSPSMLAEYDVPDLASCGAVLCTEASIYNPYLHSSALACGAVSADPVSLTLRSAPSFGAPPNRTPARAGLPFSWSSINGAIYELTLQAEEASAATPTIRIFTQGTSASWPDLSAFGIAFPKPLKAYAASVKALGEYASLDEAAGPQGLVWGTPERAFSSESQTLSVPVTPRVGKEEAQCQYPYGTAIVCSGPLDPIEGTREHYMLAPINNKLRHYPEFAKAVGIHCVRDCAGARAYMAAYEKYSGEHPGFDADEPIEPMDPPPPPPDELLRRIRGSVPNASAPKRAASGAGARDAGAP